MTLKGTVAGTATVTAKATTATTKTATVALVADTSTATVTGLVASPTSITANGTATSTLTATVKDGNGNALGAGIAVTFSTTTGTLSSASATTNASGQASVTLKGTVAGTATVTAKASTSTTEKVTVTLTSAAPVITSFTEAGGNSSSNTLVSNQLMINTDSMFWYKTEWAWEVEGADRYELIDPWGSILYSGTANSLSWPKQTLIPSSVSINYSAQKLDGTKGKYTLKAYKGDLVSEATLSINQAADYCSNCGS